MPWLLMPTRTLRLAKSDLSVGARPALRAVPTRGRFARGLLRGLAIRTRNANPTRMVAALVVLQPSEHHLEHHLCVTTGSPG
jgi:hypothetical protein